MISKLLHPHSQWVPLPRLLLWLVILVHLTAQLCQAQRSQQISPPGPIGTARSLPSEESNGSGSSIEGISIPLTDEELDQLEKEKTRNVVRLAATDQLNSEIITNRTRGEFDYNFTRTFHLHCQSHLDHLDNWSWAGETAASTSATWLHLALSRFAGTFSTVFCWTSGSGCFWGCFL